jgi:hypothetical protein
MPCMHSVLPFVVLDGVLLQPAALADSNATLRGSQGEVT